MPKHYKIASVPIGISKYQAMELQKVLNSGYGLEFKSDFKDGSVWVLGKEVEPVLFQLMIEDDEHWMGWEQKKMDAIDRRSAKAKVKPDLKWYRDPDFRKGFESVIYILIGMFLFHILTIL